MLYTSLANPWVIYFKAHLRVDVLRVTHRALSDDDILTLERTQFRTIKKLSGDRVLQRVNQNMAASKTSLHVNRWS